LDPSTPQCSRLSMQFRRRKCNQQVIRSCHRVEGLKGHGLPQWKMVSTTNSFMRLGRIPVNFYGEKKYHDFRDIGLLQLLFWTSCLRKWCLVQA
jgi:hypothetical protein